MFTAITNGIKVSAEVYYQKGHSVPAKGEFVFAYRITIENNSQYTIQLQRRKWIIFDSFGFERIVEGDGVVGKQPVIEPTKSHSYISGCQLSSEFGTMKGHYTMKRITDGELFEVEIPRFLMQAPMKLN